MATWQVTLRRGGGTKVVSFKAETEEEAVEAYATWSLKPINKKWFTWAIKSMEPVIEA